MSVAGGEAMASHRERVRMWGNRGAGNKPDEGIWFFAAKRGWRSDECALGIAAEMIFGMGRMRYAQRQWMPKIIVAESPTARRKTITIVGTGMVSHDLATLGSVASLAAPERPNKKVDA